LLPHNWKATRAAFNNELNNGVFDRSSWSEAAEAGITEHQTGKDWDPFTGLYYFGVRWYDPAVGRFISRSPLPPDIEGRYLYCDNNPFNFMDIDGHMVRDGNTPLQYSLVKQHWRRS
jgi:RHS repeat-associated protein